MQVSLDAIDRCISTVDAMTLALSIVVVAYDMERELPRTLHSLSPAYQDGIDANDYEVIVVDNGSPQPIDIDGVVPREGTFRFHRLEPAPPSPALAANTGIGLARGAAIGLIIDGARIASPGLLSTARRGLGLVPDPVVTSLAWHLGPTRQSATTRVEHDPAAEDALLDRIGWPAAGYRLFEISTLADSSSRGWFGPIGESSALFMSRSRWAELGGLEPAFDLPGGGLVNHDLFRRSIEADPSNLVVLLGEGTFHQSHGGAATSGRFTWDEMQANYQQIRGTPYARPPQDPSYVGRIAPEARVHLRASIDALTDPDPDTATSAAARSGATRRRSWSRGRR